MFFYFILFFHFNEVPIYTQFFKVYNVLPFVLFNRDMMVWWAFLRLWVGLPLATLWPKGSG